MVLFVAQNNGKESKPVGERVSIIGTGKESKPVGERVSIIGTGNFARALAKRLLQNGFSVVCGSRSPGRRDLTKYDDTLADVLVTSIDTALNQADMVFLALPAAAIVPTLTSFQDGIAGKILVDVSNPDEKKRDCKTESTAECIAKSFPEAAVVKAFNTISAYAIEFDYTSGVRNVYVAGNDDDACSKVRDVARAIGFTPVQFGRLPKAAELEAMQYELFGNWIAPLVLSSVVFLAWFLFGLWRFQIKRGGDWVRLPLKSMNKIIGATAITQLALCFLAGGFAGVTQLINGTKYKRFPNWLDRLMRMRKELGLLALCLAAVHAVMCLAHMSPHLLRQVVRRHDGHGVGNRRHRGVHTGQVRPQLERPMHHVHGRRRHVLLDHRRSRFAAWNR
ncbi:Metalloreductase STEAP4 [Lamellibrachia satsuma]|nr:Metalloreductase STEAP4 [Lamellibrachia satsuma]